MRPLLSGVRKSDLLGYLQERNLKWREDASNASPKYQRNRVRQLLARHPALVPLLLEVQSRFGALSRELEALAPAFGEQIPLKSLSAMHPLVQLHALRQWAIARGASTDDLTLELLHRVRLMYEDMASGPSVPLPGGIEIRRRAGTLVANDAAKCNMG